jgi:hypothetical protein
MDISNLNSIFDNYIQDIALLRHRSGFGVSCQWFDDYRKCPWVLLNDGCAWATEEWTPQMIKDGRDHYYDSLDRGAGTQTSMAKPRRMLGERSVAE